ncbi:MAG TPA: rhodanese-like domain-containing protein, partial [Solirubrobacterales bacterium]|nr:rhodanese-like domain-containing protein [Solirubrobacterales bacterium]
RIGDEEEFVERALAGLGPQPPNFEAIVGLNRGPLVTDGVEVAPLAPRQVESHRGEGALLVDVRTDTQFDEAHIAGAVCIPTMRAGFGTKLAWLADREQPIVLVGRDGSEAREAGRLALAVGIRRLAGYLDGGMSAWREEGRPVERIERLEVDELPARLAAAGAAGAAEVAGADAAGAAAAGGLQLLDVREVSEWEEGHLAGSVHAPWHDIEGVPDGIDPTAPVAVMCASGQRAATAVSLLQRFGGERVIHVVGGGVGRALELGLAPAGDPPGARGG